MNYDSFLISSYNQRNNKPRLVKKKQHLCSTLINFPTCVLTTGEKVTMFPVLDIDQNDIVDTNGAGDAFVGGTA